MNNFGSLFGGSIIVGVLLCCGIFLLTLFVFLPLPFLISAAILKIEGRNYWKAFGTGVLSVIANSIVGGIITAIFGGLAATNLISNGDFTEMFSRFMGSIGLLMVPGIISGLIGIIITILMAMWMYKVTFGKGALIWLVAWLFGILLGVVAALVAFLITLAVGVNLRDLIGGGSNYYFLPAIKLFM